MIAGVDGCRGGWVVALSEDWPCVRRPALRLCEDFTLVLGTTAACDVVVVDMPIGLPRGATLRACDIAAKGMLGPCASRVFLSPPRGAIGAVTPTEFQARYRRARGAGAAVPLWGIVPKIIEVDAAMTPALQGRVVEFHPELAWQRLGGRVLASKHSRPGLRDRAALLRPFVHDLEATPPDDVLRHARRDDVLDALVGLSVAAAIAAGCGRRLPEREPDVDERGLRMEIWY